MELLAYPKVEFWREVSAELTRNIQSMLRTAGEPVTRETIMQFVESLPWSSTDLDDPEFRQRFCYATCQHAYQADEEWADELVDYFFVAFVLRPRMIQKMLRECVLGVLEGMEGNIYVE